MKTRLPILDIWIDAVSREEAMTCVRGYIRHGNRPHSIFASNPEKQFSVPKDAELYESYRQADLLIPDGIGMIKAARYLYGIELKRIPGAEFILDICEVARQEDCGIFVYGAREDVNARSCKVLEARFSGLKIVGRANGYLKDGDMPGLIDEINCSGATVLFIALGSPRQEKWFARYKSELKHVRVVQGIGGTLDTIGGNVKRAPAFWRRHHIEWLYRLLSEPKRFARQLVLPVFVWRVVLERIRRKNDALVKSQKMKIIE